jgi:hypothetical protein
MLFGVWITSRMLLELGIDTAVSEECIVERGVRIGRQCRGYWGHDGNGL